MVSQSTDKTGRKISSGGDFPQKAAGEALFISNLHFGPLSGTPDMMARAYLGANYQMLHMVQALDDLVLIKAEVSPAGVHVRYNQTYAGIKIYQSDLVVSIDRNNYVEFLSSNYKWGFSVPVTIPKLSSPEAIQAARSALGVTGSLHGEQTAELMIYVEQARGRLVYRVVIPAFTPRGDWEVFVDASTGVVISVNDMTQFLVEQRKPKSAPLAKSLPILTPRPEIQDLVGRVSAAAVTSNMRRLEQFRFRYVGSAAGRDSLAQSRNWIIAQLQSYGYTDVVQHDFTYAGNTLQNIVVTKPGLRYPDTMVVIGGHYDTVNGPGTDDNGSGTSLVLEAARILADKNFEYTIKFIFFSAEEQGLIGSQAWVQNVAVPGNYHIKLMMNADMIGYSGGGSTVEVEKDTDPNPPGNNAASALYTDTLAALTELYSTLTTQIASAYGSDYISFEDAGYVITGFFENPENPHYHQPSDSLVYSDTNYVTQITKSAVAGLAQFAKVMSGSGYVFDPDPLSTAHALYTDPGYGDNSDADSPQLRAQRFLKTLPDLTSSGGLYQLQGPFVTDEDWDAPTIAPVTAANPDSFRFTRNQTGYEDVMVYYHLDRTQRYIQSLGFTNIQNNSIHADPHGFNGDDNSAYYPSTNKLTFGQGGVDDAEDAGVLLHEYGHAIQNGSVPGWSGSGEQGSLGEGFGDYWASSYGRRFNLWLPTDQQYYWVFQWDGHNNFWPGRVLNYSAHYPEGITGDIHTDGQMWASTLMSAWNDIGYQVLDRLVLQSHFYLASSGVTMTQNAQAVIQADRNLYGGAHVQTLVYWFGQRGFINPADYVPSIVHTPRGDSENPFGPFPVTATVFPGGASVDTNYIKVFWGRTGSFTDSLNMARTSNPNEWTANIPGNGYSATYIYYIKVKDVTGSVATSPPNAPTNYHSFFVGDDTLKPVIVHTPLRNQPKLRWPPVVSASVTDNLGVDSVWVEFTRLRSSLSGAFPLPHSAGSVYSALFALDSSLVQFGDTIQYRLFARDIALAHNTSIHPPTGFHTFSIINTKGLVLIVDDDAATKDGYEVTDKGTFSYKAQDKGKAGRLMSRTLTDYGFLVDTVSFDTHDPSIYPAYDIVIWTAGTTSTALFSDAAKRTALIQRANSGGKIWIEGGEVGYIFRKSTSDLDPTFRRAVLHDSVWISDVSSSSLVITNPTHPIFNIPNAVTGPIAFTGSSVTARDAMTLIPGDLGAYKVAGWSAYSSQGPDSAGLIIYDNNPNPLSAQIVFFPFALGEVTDTLTARKLIENTAEYLMTSEPPPSGAIGGIVSLSDTTDYSGVSVRLTGLTVLRHDSLVTGVDGSYSFSGLYAGSYRVTVSKAGYYPVASSRDTSVGTSVVGGVDFNLTPLLYAAVSGVVSLADTTDYRGITVSVVGQGLTSLTDSTGTYSFTSVIPGNITIRALKAGYRTTSKDTVVGNGGSITVNLRLPVETILIYETFETSAVDGIPSGWTRVDVNGDGNTWKTVSDTAYNHTPSGTKGIKYTYNSSNAANDWLITPELSLQVGVPYRYSFWYRTNSASYIEKIEMMWGTSPTPGALTNLIFRKEDINNTSFARAEGAFMVPATGSYYVGFHVYSGINQYNPGIDDILIEVAPENDIGVSKLWVPLAKVMNGALPPPDADGIRRINEAEQLEAEKAGKAAGGGYIPWLESEVPQGFAVSKTDSVITLAEVMNYGTLSQGAYNVKWTVGGAGQPPVASTRSLPPGMKDTLKLVWHWPVVGLNSVVAYTDLAADANRTNDTARSFINVLPGGTLLSESFEGGTSLPAGWSTAVVTTGSTLPAWTIITGVGTNPAAPPYSGTNQAKFNSFSATTGSQARLTSRRLNLPSGYSRLTFFMYHDPGYTTSFDSITVQASTGDSVTGPWLWLGKFVRYSATTGWKKDSVDLSAFAAQPKVYVSFLATSRYGNNMYLDEVNLFTYTVLASISGIKYEDVDGDSTRDSGEPLLAGWKIYLGGAATDSAVTDGSGAYSFNNLQAGVYTVSESLKAGWGQITPGGIYSLTVGEGEHLMGKNFGNYRKATISGVKFNDINGDSVKNIGVDQFLPGWKIYLAKGSHKDSAITDGVGAFAFGNLSPGNYMLSESLKAGWVQTLPAAPFYNIALQSGQVLTGKDFGNFSVSSISGRLFDDIASDSTGSGDPGLPGWKVYLALGGGHPRRDSVITDGSGVYSFSNLTPGTYSLSESLKTGWLRTAPPGPTHTVTVQSGQGVTGRDFGNFKLGSLAGLIWKDADGNGSKDAGEGAISGWTVNVSGAIPGNTHQTVADGAGNYSVQGLIRDTYTISEVKAAGYTQTHPAPPGTHTVIIRSGLDSAGLDFGNFYPDTARYRTFSKDSLTFAKDAKGKVGGIIKAKADKVDFAFTLLAPKNTKLTLAFSASASGSMLIDSGKKGGYTSISGKKWVWISPIDSGAIVQVVGRGATGKSIKVKYEWGTATRSIKGTVTDFTYNIPRLPMPNAVNLVADMFARGAFDSTGGLVVGSVLSGADAQRYGWVQIGKYTDVFKSLYQRNSFHVGSPHYFDVIGTKTFAGRQKTLPPTKHNNMLFAEILALKVNIFSSRAGETPPGFGELIYDDGTLSSLCGLTISEIAGEADHFMTYGNSPLGVSADSFYHTVRMLNRAFEGVIDTSSFASGLVFTGVHRLSEVSFLKPNFAEEPRRIALKSNFSGEETPSEFRLYQNYPNPFNPTTNIDFALPLPGTVTLNVYDILGREVARLFDREQMEEGNYTVEFSAGSLASGVYFYRILVEVTPDNPEDGAAAQTFTSVKKLLLMK